MDAIEFEFVGEKRDEQGSTLFPNVSGVLSTTCELAASRDATAATEVVALREDDLIEVETSDGAWLLTRHQFLALTNLDNDGFQLDAAGNRSGDSSGKPRLPLAVQFDDGKRGIISWTLKALRILNIDVAGFLVKKVAKAIDGSLVHNDQPGLYAVGRDGELTSAAISSGTEPVLLLVHGTGSATLRAFGDLIPNNKSTDFQKAPWQTIHDAFNGRVFAFEHPTLTVPVAENALALLSALPVSGCPPLVILSHSRGGLVSDVLTSAQHPENHDENFLEALQRGASGEDRDDADEVEKLCELYRLARDRGVGNLPKVVRHVRVGCPAAGTSLAGPNTNLYLTALAKLFSKVPDLPIVGTIGDIAEALLRLAAGVVKEGLRPGVLPGIGSMKPESTLVNLLDSMTSNTGELMVISGDASGVADKLLLPIFLGPHDCVVDTPSMRIGYQYARVDEHALIGDGIVHTNYFGRLDVQEQLLNALKPTETVLTGARARGAVRGRLPPAKIDQALDRPCILFVPGFLGSELSNKKGGDIDDIWLDVWRLIRGRGLELAIDNPSVSTTGVLDKVYEDFVEHAKARAHVVPFAFDWRQAIEAPVDEFEGLVRTRLHRSTLPITIVSHSMGGLVARAWRQKYPNTWKRLVARGGFLVQGGTPNLGTWQVPLIFSGDHKLLRKLAFFDLRHDKRDWQRMIAAYPGPAQMAVYDDTLLDDGEPNLKTEKGWRQIGARSVQPATALRKLAKDTADTRKSDGFAEDSHIVYVAGCSDATPALERVDGTFTLVDSAEGDGLALWASAGKSPDYFVDSEHGNIYNNAKDFDALLDIAFTGKTTALRTRPPSQGERGAGPAALTRVRAKLSLSETPGLRSASEQLLEAATHGGQSGSGATDRLDGAPLDVEVIHGNLMFCQAPVVVGHYRGDRIVRAESTLDNHLGGVLTQRWRLGPDFYVSGPGTSQIVLSDTARGNFGPTGAIVVGLGRMGELTHA
ncbi:MAG: hypothetical protein AAF499_00850, partial [Pseudomonadota bacterium]